jgi:hypothetical protein
MLGEKQLKFRVFVVVNYVLIIYVDGGRLVVVVLYMHIGLVSVLVHLRN